MSRLACWAAGLLCAAHVASGAHEAGPAAAASATVRVASLPVPAAPASSPTLSAAAMSRPLAASAAALSTGSNRGPRIESQAASAVPVAR